MSIRFRPCNPCCNCVYLFDAFSRNTDNVSSDRVNMVNSRRYHFASGTWIVYLPSGVLISQNSNEEILYYDKDVEKLLDTHLNFTLRTSNDYISVINGDVIFTLEGINATGLRATVGGYTIDAPISGFPFTSSIINEIFDKNTYIPSGECVYEYSTSLFSFAVLGVFNDGCHLINLDDIIGNYTKYGLKATSGVIIDNLSVIIAETGCHTPPNRTCKTICWPDAIPASVSIEFNGFPDTEIPCIYTSHSGYINCVTLAGTEYNTCINDAILTLCQCESLYAAQLCLCYDTNAECKAGCPSNALNSTFVLDLIGSSTVNYCLECVYKYRLEYNPFYNPANPIDTNTGGGDLCNEINVSGSYFDITANITVGSYFDCETKEVGVEFSINVPFSTPLSSSGEAMSTSFCAGGSFPVTPSTINIPSGDYLSLAYRTASGVLSDCNAGGKWYSVCGFPSGVCPSTEQEKICSDSGDIEIIIGDLTT